MLGIISAHEAQKIANTKNLDLVEISKGPPIICKIIDYGKYKYSKDKQDQGSVVSKKKLKEIKFRINIGEGEIKMKATHVIEFIQKGHDVKIELKLRNNEVRFMEFAKEKFAKFMEHLQNDTKSASEPKVGAKSIITIVTKK